MDGGTEQPEGIATGPSQRPPQFVAGVIDDADQVEGAIEELTALGVQRESIGVLQGERGADAIAGRHAYGLRSWFQRAAETLSDEAEYFDRFQEAARAGRYVVGIPLPDASEATQERVREILTKRGAHSLVFSSRWTHSGDE